MTHYCNVKTITDLQACTQCDTNQICCKDCIKIRHKGHISVNLSSSDVFRNFLKITHVQWLVGQKVLKSLGDFNIAQEQTKIGIVNWAFYGSSFFKQLINEQKTLQQYGLLKALYNGTPITFQTLSGLQKILNEVKTQDIISSYISKLTQYTQQQKQMSSHLDFYTGADSYYLQQFITYQQQLFCQYLQIITKEGSFFDIYLYLKWREQQEREKNPIYYSKQFTVFLIEYYRKDASEKGLFTINDYVLNFWQYFSTCVQNNPTLKQYLDSQVDFYKQYEKLMQQNGLVISYLGFRIWKLSNGVSKELPFLKNHYFLFTFVEAFITMLIEKTYAFRTSQQKEADSKLTCLSYLKYLKDYVHYIQQKNKTIEAASSLSLSFGQYLKYFTFRARLQPLNQILAKSKDNIYDKQVAIRFFNEYYCSGKIIKIPLYKQFFERQENQKIKKQAQFLQKVQSLKAELILEQKDNFYEFVYVNFIAYCQEQELTLKKQTYYAFKQGVIDSTDIGYLQETEQKFKRGDFNQKDEDYEEEQELDKINDKEERIEIIGQTGAKITNVIDRFEQQLYELQGQQEDDNIECPCCKGQSYDCTNEDCQIMGYCTACSF